MIIASEFWIWEEDDFRGGKVYYLRLTTNVSLTRLTNYLRALKVHEHIEAIYPTADDRAQGRNGFVLKWEGGVTVEDVHSLIERF